MAVHDINVPQTTATPSTVENGQAFTIRSFFENFLSNDDSMDIYWDFRNPQTGETIKTVIRSGFIAPPLSSSEASMQSSITTSYRGPLDVLVTLMEAGTTSTFFQREFNSVLTISGAPIGTGTINGVVFDRTTGQPLSSVQVNFYSEQTLTGEDGSYHLEADPSTGTLRFQKQDYKPENRTITVREREITSIIVNMEKIKSSKTMLYVAGAAAVGIIALIMMKGK